jgi:hypothetical protein
VYPTDVERSHHRPSWGLGRRNWGAPRVRAGDNGPGCLLLNAVKDASAQYFDSLSMVAKVNILSAMAANGTERAAPARSSPSSRTGFGMTARSVPPSRVSFAATRGFAVLGHGAGTAINARPGGQGPTHAGDAARPCSSVPQSRAPCPFRCRPCSDGAPAGGVAQGHEMAQPSIDRCERGELVFIDDGHFVAHDAAHLLAFLAAGTEQPDAT